MDEKWVIVLTFKDTHDVHAMIGPFSSEKEALYNVPVDTGEFHWTVLNMTSFVLVKM